MPTYAISGSLVTDKREVATSEAWDTQTEWEEYESITDIEIIDGVLQLEEINIPAGITDRWLINAGSGSTFNNDLSDRDISLTGGSWQNDTGSYDNYNYLFGSGDYGENTDSYFADLTNFTFSAWIRYDGTDTRDGYIAGHTNANGLSETHSWGVGLIADDMRVSIDSSSTGDGPVIKVNGNDWITQNWEHIGLVFNGGNECKLYHNGVVHTDTTSVPSSTGSSGESFYIAVLADLNRQFYGEMDDIMFGDTAISDSEMNDIYQQNPRS